MRRKAIAVLLIMTCSFTLLACGTPMYELTSEEEEQIVEATAQIVSKYNIRQKDGMNWVEFEEEEEESQNTEETQQKPDEEDEEKPDKGEQTDSDKKEEPVKGNEASLAEALGYGGSLSFAYQGLKMDSSYVQDGAMVSADNGKQLCILEFNMTNTSKEKLELDFTKSDVKYRLKLSDGSSASQKMSFFAQDLVSYTGSLQAWESVKVILLFETKAEKVEKPSLNVNRAGKSYSVNL